MGNLSLLLALVMSIAVVFFGIVMSPESGTPWVWAMACSVSYSHPGFPQATEMKPCSVNDTHCSGCSASR
jgi:hypothetical protein